MTGLPRTSVEGLRALRQTLAGRLDTRGDMRIYLAARYGRRAEMWGVAEDLKAAGHLVVSRWVWACDRLLDDLFNTDWHLRETVGARFAQEDLYDLLEADCIIAFTEDPGTPPTGSARGGRHFEAGVAYWQQTRRPMRLILVGPAENIFYCLPDWEQYPDWPTCRDALVGGTRKTG